MQKMLCALVLLSAPAVAHADHARAAGSRMTPGVYPEKAPIWKRFVVKDLQLGTELDKLPGFTCDTKVGEYRHTCVRFLDDKCKGRKAYVKAISFSSDVPRGQGCTYNSASIGGNTYLDGKATVTPLHAIAVVGTDTDVPRAYEIDYTLPKDLLTDDSNLGKALIAKYGKPDYTNPPIQLRWNTKGIDDLYVAASCGTTEGPTGDYCTIQAYDGPLLASERSIKQAFEDERAVSSGPPAPKL